MESNGLTQHDSVHTKFDWLRTDCVCVTHFNEM